VLARPVKHRKQLIAHRAVMLDERNQFHVPTLPALTSAIEASKSLTISSDVCR
jgi:hypothetical protein